MKSPEGWIEPGQIPEFAEYSIVLTGMLRVEHEGGTIDDQIARIAELVGKDGVAEAERMVTELDHNVIRLAFKKLPKIGGLRLGARVDAMLAEITDVDERESVRLTLLAAKKSVKANGKAA